MLFSGQPALIYALSRPLYVVLAYVHLVGCAASMPAVGHFAGEEAAMFHGRVQISLRTGVGHIRLHDFSRGTECSGFAEVVHRPAGSVRTCSEQQAAALLRCSDGRKIEAHIYYAGSCGRAIGRGEDSTGRRFLFAFAEDETGARALLGVDAGAGTQ